MKRQFVILFLLSFVLFGGCDWLKELRPGDDTSNNNANNNSSNVTVIIQNTYVVPNLESGLKVAKPTACYYSGQPYSIYLRCETAGAVIKYTTNGYDPKFYGLVYSGIPLNVAPGTLLLVYAFKSGYVDSDLVAYSIR